MLRIAICDDDALENELTCELLSEYTELRQIEAQWVCFTSGCDLLDAVDKGRFDIYLIDMIMPEIDGMGVAQKLREKKDKGHIVFLTATGEYMPDSFTVRASNYLLKPIDTAKFYEELDRLYSEIQEEKPATTFIKQSKNTGISIPVNSILYVRIENRAPSYHLDDNSTVPGMYFRNKFNSVVSELTDKYNFVIAGAGMAVNLPRVRRLNRNENLIYFDNGSVADCSRNGAKILADAMKPKE